MPIRGDDLRRSFSTARESLNPPLGIVLRRVTSPPILPVEEMKEFFRAQRPSKRVPAQTVPSVGSQPYPKHGPTGRTIARGNKIGYSPLRIDFHDLFLRSSVAHIIKFFSPLFVRTQPFWDRLSLFGKRMRIGPTTGENRDGPFFHQSLKFPLTLTASRNARSLMDQALARHAQEPSFEDEKRSPGSSPQMLFGSERENKYPAPRSGNDGFATFDKRRCARKLGGRRQVPRAACPLHGGRVFYSLVD